MGKSRNIEFKNDKNGFRLIIAIELLLTIGILLATVHVFQTGRRNRMAASVVCLLAIVYITARSIATYRKLRLREREQETGGEESK